MTEIRFLEVDEVIAMRDDQVKKFGGSMGIRDHGLLLSAIHEPQATFLQNYLYKDHYEMAAAYAYGLIKNHPFIDGNKRTGVLLAIVFLSYHDLPYSLSQNQLYNLGIAIATSKISLREISNVLRV